MDGDDDDVDDDEFVIVIAAEIQSGSRHGIQIEKNELRQQENHHRTIVLDLRLTDNDDDDQRFAE